MGKYATISDSHIVTSSEATAGLAAIFYDFAAKRKIEIVGMTVYNTTDPYLPSAVAIRYDGSYFTLKEGVPTGQIGTHFVGPIKLEAEGLGWIIARPTANDVVNYSALWRFLD